MHADGKWLKDKKGRVLMLRGVNLSGGTKVPAVPCGASHLKDSLLDPACVSFTGKPFPLEEADEHFSRLKSWGLTFLRFLVTWEAVEHAGPGIHDEEYLSYLEEVIQKAAGYGIKVFIDPHNDMWSRWTGGDGAPGWTLEAVGMDLHLLHETGAAFVHGYHEGELPGMIWTTNQFKLGAATMFTLFFGGNDFAPAATILGEPVQEFLQTHYINAMKKVAHRLKGFSNVAGLETLNEPFPGYIGIRNLMKKQGFPLYVGTIPSPFQSMLLASGYPQEVPYYEIRGFLPVRKKRVLSAA